MIFYCSKMEKYPVDAACTCKAGQTFLVSVGDVHRLLEKTVDATGEVGKNIDAVQSLNRPQVRPSKAPQKSSYWPRQHPRSAKV